MSSNAPLLTLQQVLRATILSTADVNRAILHGGYTDRYNRAEFAGCTVNGRFVYNVYWTEHTDDETEQHGRVYIEYKWVPERNNWDLVADY